MLGPGLSGAILCSAQDSLKCDSARPGEKQVTNRPSALRQWPAPGPRQARTRPAPGFFRAKSEAWSEVGIPTLVGERSRNSDLGGWNSGLAFRPKPRSRPCFQTEAAEPASLLDRSLAFPSRKACVTGRHGPWDTSGAQALAAPLSQWLERCLCTTPGPGLDSHLRPGNLCPLMNQHCPLMNQPVSILTQIFEPWEFGRLSR